MTKFACWNIRGLNAPIKQREVRHLILQNNIDFRAVLETKVGFHNLSRVTSNILRDWEYDNNNGVCSNGRIWV